jgi:hypothetical protein
VNLSVFTYSKYASAVMPEKKNSVKNQALVHTKVLFLSSLYFLGCVHLLIRGICLVLYSLVSVYHH